MPAPAGLVAQAIVMCWPALRLAMACEAVVGALRTLASVRTVACVVPPVPPPEARPMAIARAPTPARTSAGAARKGRVRAGLVGAADRGGAVGRGAAAGRGAAVGRGGAASVR